MNLSDLLRLLPQSGDPEAAAYLNNPTSRPEINRDPRAALMPRLPQATLGQDGRRLPLPRIQGTGAHQRMQKPEAYPMVFGPSVADANQIREPARPLSFAPTAPVMRFRDAQQTVMPTSQQFAPPDTEPWRQPEQVNAGPSVSQNRLPIGSPALNRGLEPPSAPTRARPADFSDLDEDWNAARERARASIQAEDRAGMARLPRPGNPLIAQAFAPQRKAGR